MMRTHYCGELRERHIGAEAAVCGWVQTKRDMGGVIFIDLKDREGTLQVVFDQRDVSAGGFAAADRLRNQSVVRVVGVVRLRDEQTVNPKIPTGTVELRAREIEVLSEAESLPYPLDESADVREDLRLKYRFLDIRRTRMYENLRFRARLIKTARDFLDGRGFVDVETPMLTKSTPEGARDYLVPSRVHPGAFYALPQSPQIFKQLLMVGGLDKYYQVARCFRDEDLRADRQPEFTQLDMEMSFVGQEDILQHLEQMLCYMMKELTGDEPQRPFLRLTWQQAMDGYGSDKPDLRFGLKIEDVTEIAGKTSFSVFKNAIKDGGVVRAINVRGGAAFTRTQIEELTKKAIGYGAKGMAWISIGEDGQLGTILKKYFEPQVMQELFDRLGSRNGDFILFCADSLATVRRTLGGIRLDVANMLGLRKKDEYKFLFVTDFPQFEWSDEEKRFMAMHHPFTMPYPEDVDKLISDPASVRAQAYDVVINGVELGSGSIRIHDRRVQSKMFEALGFTPEQVEERFGFMVNAFKYGTPPHGGFAFGVDRLAMLLLGADSLRDVIAFPKNKDASCPMTDAPGPVDKKQLDELQLGAAAGETARLAGREKPSDIDVESVARLARLVIAPEEKEAMAKDMRAIVAFADRLSEIDTEGIEITAHVVPQKNVWREEDEPKPGFDRELLLKNAPTQADGYFTVPRVVE